MSVSSDSGASSASVAAISTWLSLAEISIDWTRAVTHPHTLPRRTATPFITNLYSRVILTQLSAMIDSSKI